VVSLLERRRAGSVALALPGLVLSMVLGALDQTIMTPALPEIAADLGGLPRMPDIVTAYLIAATVAMPVYGKLGDRFGRMPVMQAALGLFLIGAALCGLATGMAQLIAFRAIQGLGGGGLMIGAQTILGEIVSPRERGRYLGLIGAAYAVAVVGGPLLGGVLIDRFGWRWIFALYPPLCVLASAGLALTLRLPRPTRDRVRPRLDLLGAAFLAAAVVGLVLLGQTRDPRWVALAVVGAAGYLLSARRAEDPILPLQLFADRAFAVPVAIAFLLGFALFGALTYLPAYVRITQGTTATNAGLLVTALMGGVLLTSVVSGRLITRTGRYKPYPVAGTLLAGLGFVLLAVLAGGSGPAALTGVLVLTGLGVGLVMQVMVLAVQNAVAYRDLGVATSSVTFFRQVGASAGVAVAGAVLTWRLDGRPAEEALAEAMPLVFWVLVPMLAVAFGLALVLPARPLRTTAYASTYAEHAEAAERRRPAEDGAPVEAPEDRQPATAGGPEGAQGPPTARGGASDRGHDDHNDDREQP